MKAKLNKTTLAAAFALACTFTLSCSGDSSGPSCNGTSYDSNIYRCEYGEIIGKCNGEDYYLANQQCVNGVVSVISDESSSSSVAPSSSSNVLSSSSNVPSSSSEMPSSSSSANECGGTIYDPNIYRCEYGEIIGKCNGKDYYSANQSCLNGVVYPLCGVATYNPATKFCLDGVVTDKCGGEGYLVTEFCYNDKVETKCGDISTGATYNPATEACCGSSKYTVATQFCHNNSAIVNFCGINPQKSYNPDLYQCKPSVNRNGIFLINPISYQGENYEAVLLGEQTWLARNLNYNAEGSKCYAEGVEGVSVDSIAKNCKTYGRLYDWSTAMGFEATCNSSSCAEQIETPHQGICPSGWHIPSSTDWDVLVKYVDPDYVSNTINVAGTKLKARSGWNNEGNGQDTYGFSALPGDAGYSDGYFYDVGNRGYWWNSSEYDSYYAYRRYIHYNSGNAAQGLGTKPSSFSVRCVQD